jgi:hypothetical protein
MEMLGWCSIRILIPQHEYSDLVCKPCSLEQTDISEENISTFRAEEQTKEVTSAKHAESRDLLHMCRIAKDKRTFQMFRIIHL